MSHILLWKDNFFVKITFKENCPYYLWIIKSATRLCTNKQIMLCQSISGWQQKSWRWIGQNLGKLNYLQD